MFKLLVLLLSVNCVFTEEAEITSEKCKELFEPHRENIVDCCDYPRPDFEKCRSVCTDQTNGSCSCANCYREIFPREKDQYLKLYDQELNEKSADEKQNWLLVINNSFDHCKALFEIVNGTDKCQFPNSFQQMATCMRQQNFVNCDRSSFAPSEKCEATRKFLKEEATCGTKYGETFVIDNSIFLQHSNQMKMCMESFKEAKFRSMNCVFVPDILRLDYVYYKCLEQCSKRSCCFAPCVLNVTSWKDFGEEVAKDKIIEFYKSGSKNSRVGFDIWQPVIESSFGICYPLASNVIGTKECDIFKKYDVLRSCMRQELFLNAPTSLIKDSDQFKKIKTFIANETKCGQKFGKNFIIDRAFWDY